MKFENKSYSSNFSNPNPKIHFDKDNKSLIVTTCWGHNVDSSPYIESILNFYSSKLKDRDFTSPFGSLDHLDFYENTLRTSILMANQSFFKKNNEEELVSGLEIFVLIQKSNTLYMAQVGQPHILLKRGTNLNIIHTQPDLSCEYANDKYELPPLPTKLFGTNKNIDINISKIHCKKNDQLVLIKRSQIYPFNFSDSAEEVTLESISDYLVSNNSELPFWLGILDIK